MTATINTGDCLAWLRSMPDSSVDSIVTDPPYGLSNIKPERIAEAITAWATGDRERVPDGKGFMGKAWDSFVPPPAVWDECLRVLKPGGHLVAFAGSRTHDLMGMSIRMAGFEIRDGLAWLYGSGFPKSMDVSKAIDKAAGVEGKRGPMKRGGERLARLGDGKRDGGGTWGDEVGRDPYTYLPGSAEVEQWQGWGTALKPAFEPVTLARKPLEGTVAANVLKWGTGALNIDATRIGGEVLPARVRGVTQMGTFLGADGNTTPERTGRWPANVVLDEHQAAALDEQVEGASRFMYCAKASSKERPEVDGVKHPTVKPLSLMRWLVRLVTPPDGLVLDPFAGSGSTIEAAMLEGFNVAGCEIDPAYVKLIQHRIERASDNLFASI